MTDFTPTRQEDAETITDLRDRLQRATEALREIDGCFIRASDGTRTYAGAVPALTKIDRIACQALAALAGEDDATPPPQREGDYL